MVIRAAAVPARGRAGAGSRSAGRGAENDDRSGAAGARARDDAGACRTIAASCRLPGDDEEGGGGGNTAAGQ